MRYSHAFSEFELEVLSIFLISFDFQPILSQDITDVGLSVVPCWHRICNLCYLVKDMILGHGKMKLRKRLVIIESLIVATGTVAYAILTLAHLM